jgi:hypothetical protein
LFALRKRAEDPANRKWTPDHMSSVLGEERYQQIVKEAKEILDGSMMEILLTPEDKAKISANPRKAPEARLSHDVLVIFEVSGVEKESGAAILYRHASFSRNDAETGRRERLPERYVLQAIAKLGFTEAAKVSLNSGSGVWHAFEDFKLSDEDVVGTPLPPVKKVLDDRNSYAMRDDEGCAIGRSIFYRVEELPPEVTAAFTGLTKLQADDSRGLGHIRIIGGTEDGRSFLGWRGHRAAPMVALTEQWVNHLAFCPACREMRQDMRSSFPLGTEN